MIGLKGEKMLSELVRLYPKTFRKVAVKESSQRLAELAIQYVPNKVNTLLKAVNCSTIELSQKPQAWLLDHLYNCDCLIAVNLGGQVRLVAVDVTADPSKVISKEKKMEKQADLMKSIGFEVGLICLWDLESKDLLWDLDLAETKELELFKTWGRQIWETVKIIDSGPNFAGSTILSRN